MSCHACSLHLEKLMKYCSEHNAKQLQSWASEGFFPGGAKVVKFVFYPSKLKKQPFLLIISKSRGGQGPTHATPLRRPCLQYKNFTTNYSVLGCIKPLHSVVSVHIKTSMYCICSEVRLLNRFCEVAILSQVVRHLKAEKEHSLQHELTGIVRRVFDM